MTLLIVFTATSAILSYRAGFAFGQYIFPAQEGDKK